MVSLRSANSSEGDVPGQALHERGSRGERFPVGEAREQKNASSEFLGKLFVRK